ncbi:MAG: hypothetical protein DHS20C02_02850 [Micavibrio sp.]|nr:MAG: hypothetical protein DHS20C02_02850 [Micavibrio sp.]
MIRVLGAKRVLLLVVLMAVNILFAFAVYGYMMPEKIKTERNLRSLRGQISTVQQDINHLQIEFEQLEEQQAKYQQLEKDGFFRAQGRREAQDLFERIQDSSKVISAVASIRAGEIEDHVEAQKAAHKLLVSPVDLKIEALSDVAVFRYLYLLEKSFPGHIAVNKIDLKRTQNLNAAVLRSITTGSNLSLVEADISLLWRTMIPEANVREDEKE